jgi:hypothetical protein
MVLRMDGEAEELSITLSRVMLITGLLAFSLTAMISSGTFGQQSQRWQKDCFLNCVADQRQKEREQQAAAAEKQAAAAERERRRQAAAAEREWYQSLYWPPCD